MGQYIIFDKDDETFYNNYYLEDFKCVVKIPLISEGKNTFDIGIERFSLNNRAYLLAYE